MVCFTFMVLVSALFSLVRSLILPRTALAPQKILSQIWKNWREILIIVKPETVIKWNRQGFKLYWRWKSKAPVGRPKVDKEICELIGKISRENLLWGVPCIQAELRLLGYDLAESTVAKYRARGRNVSVANLEDISYQSYKVDCGC
jgi:hypothetical protein